MEPTVALVPEELTSRVEAASPTGRLEEVLRFAASRSIADVYLKPGQRPLYRRFCQLISRRDEATFAAEDLQAILTAWLPPRCGQQWQTTGRTTWLQVVVSSGRFRVTALRTAGEPALAIHVLPARLASLRELNLPRTLAAWSQWNHGLVLVASAPGGGRTTTWLALLEQVNTTSASALQIVTLENPCEQRLDDKVAFVQQRELGSDVADLQRGLDDALAQHADVIGVGELTAGEVAAAAEVAGLQRLVVGCIRAADAIDVLRQAVSAQAPHLREAFRSQLSRRLRGVVHTSLLPSADGKATVAVCEMLVVTPLVAEFLRSDRDLDGLVALIDSAAGRQAGMASRDGALAEAVQQGLVSLDTAQRHARDTESFRARVAGRPFAATAANSPLASSVVLPPTGHLTADADREPML